MTPGVALNPDFQDLLEALRGHGVEFLVVGAACARGPRGAPGDRRPGHLGACHGGLPPRRIDLLTQLSGLAFDEAWPGRVEVAVAGAPVPFLGREALLKNKRATGCAKDLVDAALLESTAR